MTESVSASSNDAAAAAQRSAEQARLRKERREAKIKAGGASRLDKITGMGGRIVGETESPPPPAATSPPASAPDTHGDPDEVDISEHFQPSDAPPAMSESQLRQMMLGLDRPGTSGPGTPMEGLGGEDDPIMKMMSQMMGGGGGGSEAGSPFQAMQQPQPAPSGYHTFWRVIHAILAIGLGLYVVFLTPFLGTKGERDAAAIAHTRHLAADDENEEHKRMFFWLFASSEAVLLTTRFFFDKGRDPPPGFVWTLVSYVPEPFKGYLSVVLRYGQIFTTVRTDILTCMFVLGVCSYLRSW